MTTIIPSGYKFSPLGAIPSDWELLSLGEVVDKNIKWSLTGGPFGSNLMSKDYTEDGIRIIQLQNIGDGEFLDNYKIYTSKEKADELLSCNIYPGEIILSKMGDPVARACIIPETEDRFLMASDGIRLSPDKKRYNNLFLLNYINFDVFRNEAKKTSTGSTRQRIGLDDLKSLKIITPRLEEQNTIASLLSTWDEAISKVSKLIGQHERRKLAIIQSLFSQKNDWKIIFIIDIAKEVSIKNKKNEELIVLSCTKYDGLIPSLEYFGRKIYSDDLSTYKLVPRNHFAYATNHIEEGSIGYQSKFDQSLISPMYTVFQTDESMINDGFLFRLLKSHTYIHEYKKRMEGSIDRRGGLRWQEFSKIKIPLPSLDEQVGIIKILELADQEIQLLRSKLEKFKEQKKGLMQQLLTGKKRLKF